MNELSGKDKFFMLFIAIHLLSFIMSIITGLLTNLLTGIISYLLYIHLTASAAYLANERTDLNLEKIKGTV